MIRGQLSGVTSTEGEKIPAISLWQPWATLIVIGAKKIETRSWPITHRGLIAIHAARHFGEFEGALCGKHPFREALAAAGYTDVAQLPTGAIVGTAELVECTVITRYNLPEEPERSFGDYRPGRFRWFLQQARQISPPIPWTGKQGIFHVPKGVIA